MIRARVPLRLSLILILSGALTGCLIHHSPNAVPNLPSETATIEIPAETIAPAATDTPEPTPEPTAEPTIEPTATVVPTLSAAQWREWEILPSSVSEKVKEIYAAGLEAGNDPKRFSKVGDSNSVLPSFLSCFDFGEFGYTLGEYESLAPTIDQFRWSFSRASRAAENGKTAYDLDMIHWYSDDECWPYESATTCEYRLWQPSIAFISLGSNDVYMKVSDFDKHMRSLVDKTIDRFSIVPILVTKADNLDGDGSFNQTIAQIALDYELPLLNLWRAMEPLPNHGLQIDNVHPTANSVSLCDFSGDDLSTYGWTVRNLTALQTLDRVYQLLNQP